MILHAASLTSWQRARRRWALERQWVPSRWNPKSLFDATLRKALFQMSNAKLESKAAAQEAVTRYMTLAANPGLDLVSGDPYVIAMDYCAMLRTILEFAGRTPLLMVRHPPDVILLGDHKHSDHKWQPLSWQDESGMLHRWITVDAWDADRISQEIHGWFVFGDIAALEQSMMIHAIIIGQIRSGRRTSPWARTYKHPAIANTYRFQKDDGGVLAEGWKPFYFANNPDSNATHWVDLMLAQNVNPVQHITVKAPTPEHIAEFREEVAEEAGAMAQASKREPLSLPRCRVACDFPKVCGFQQACFSSGPVTIENFAGFRRRLTV